MPTASLTFLYPHLFRGIRLAESAGQKTKIRCRKSSAHRQQYAAPFSTSVRTRQTSFERHGKAVEPLPVNPNGRKFPQLDKDASKTSKKDPDVSSTGIGENHEAKSRGQEKASTNETEKTSDATKESEKAESSPAPVSPGQIRQQASPAAASEEKMRHSGPMEVVLHMPPPDSASHHPHISASRYMHHFDTYTLVKQLESGGYTNAQAITLMKAVRGMLARNLDFAQEGLVSKSDVDNEKYLFNAACSELSAEVVKNRRAADETTRQQRTHLQHEVDILSQRMSQDLQNLKDEVKGMFNDRKMTVQEEQRTMESKIQQINLKISVLLNSEAKSEIEALRWILIRRSVLGILFMAVLTLAMLRYTTYVSQKRQREAQEKARQAEELKRNGGKEDRAPPIDAAQILAAN
ncbi:hypothetical protein DL769_010390 [Monosporascus sp. CRB-8-3]|nr:hypothetical protein DL769_010390 [Monosporascus sp. CRB-8-3]